VFKRTEPSIIMNTFSQKILPV